MGRFVRPTVNSARPRRPMDWVCGEMDGSVVETKFANWLRAPSYFQENFTDPTAMALMVWGEVAPGGTTVAGDIIAFGVIAWNYLSDAELAAADAPGPISNSEADWMYLWYSPYIAGLPAGATAVRDIGGNELDRRSSAKRRLGNDRALLMVTESIGSFVFHYHVRALIKE